VPANLFLLAPKVRGNPYRSALRSAPLSSQLNTAANFLWNASLTAQLQWLLWRGAFWCYLAYLVLFAYSRPAGTGRSCHSERFWWASS